VHIEGISRDKCPEYFFLFRVWLRLHTHGHEAGIALIPAPVVDLSMDPLEKW
jgi:hypothetical protein